MKAGSCWRRLSFLPGLENPSEGPLSDISNVLDVVPRILEGQHLGVHQQGDPLVHGVRVESIQQELRRQRAQSRDLHRSAGRKTQDGVNRAVDGSKVRVGTASHLFRLLHCFLRLRQVRTTMPRKTAAASVVRTMTMTDME